MIERDICGKKLFIGALLVQKEVKNYEIKGEN